MRISAIFKLCPDQQQRQEQAEACCADGLDEFDECHLPPPELLALEPEEVLCCNCASIWRFISTIAGLASFHGRPTNPSFIVFNSHGGISSLINSMLMP
jgi:hypothetical protein